MDKMFGLPLIKLGTFFACTITRGGFFGLPPWWEYLKPVTDEIGECVPSFSFPNDVWAVALAIIDMLIRIGGLVAIFSIVLAGVQYIMASGSPEKAATARQRIYNALIGLAIVSIAAALVAFIGNKLGT